MSAISDFAAKQAEHNARVTEALNDLAGDITTLNDKISELQNSAGSVTPEDQALIDDLEVKGGELAARAEALADLTPPKPPVEPTGGGGHGEEQ